jgi:predicted nucleic acid-binding protein
MDALHVASAVEAGASYFLTTDKALLRKMVAERRIRVVDPLDFVRLIEGTTDEN